MHWLALLVSLEATCALALLTAAALLRKTEGAGSTLDGWVTSFHGWLQRTPRVFVESLSTTPGGDLLNLSLGEVFSLEHPFLWPQSPVRRDLLQQPALPSGTVVIGTVHARDDVEVDLSLVTSSSSVWMPSLLGYPRGADVVRFPMQRTRIKGRRGGRLYRGVVSGGGTYLLTAIEATVRVEPLPDQIRHLERLRWWRWWWGDYPAPRAVR